jgi:hypothetical protein
MLQEQFPLGKTNKSGLIRVRQEFVILAVRNFDSAGPAESVCAAIAKDTVMDAASKLLGAE